MSDVEKICEQNHQRVKWAEEYEYADQPEPMIRVPSRREKARAMHRQKVMRVAALACAMFTGMGASLVGMGIASMHLPTLITGSAAALVFLTSGVAFEAKADRAMEEVTAHG